ncbi:adenine deaminase [Salipaludibacillus sp. LMS25]|jgi:adenine deaminase|uniref:adenine deaminase n=1 Tax=Salipaludibacillus sp. LMS25 TaxID=2924031 RepID=UPI0020D196F2|nr:adenine deaminase [Salipaludibacillus sp. LMS25]UTR13890.1 adenine deaminase [Salipaludibacillus sp. LMS25]
MGEKRDLINRIHVANKVAPADLVIKNGKIVNVFTLEIEEGDVAIYNGVIVGIGNYEGKEEVDAKGKYVVPGLIDGHVHIESSMVPPHKFSDVVVPHGVTTVITDPHEIANVTGTDGIQFMLDDSEGVPLDVLFMLPSCVPATPFEHSGATLTAEDLAPFYSHERVLGLAEVMDYPSTAAGAPDMATKIHDALRKGKLIDGHGAGLDAEAMNVYGTARITTDHECTTAEEAAERIKKGLYVLIREGSAAKDLQALIPQVNATNARRFLFCTDDKHLDELIAEGSIDANIRLAVKCGLDPMMAIQLATLNAAECYGLKTKGAVAPGYIADLLLVDDLDQFTISHVFKDGELVAEDGKIKPGQEKECHLPEKLTNTVNTAEVTLEKLAIPASDSGQAYAIKLHANSLVTEKIIVEPPQQKENFTSSPVEGLLKLAVIERHHQTGNIGLGFIQGLGLKEGAIALTVAHDSHNLVVAGADDKEMLKAINEVEKMNGGMVIVKKGKPIAALPLTIAGLMSSESAEETLAKMKDVDHALEKLGFTGNFNPFSALSFMCLPVIPQLKLTDMGYFDSTLGTHVSIAVDN